MRRWTIEYWNDEDKRVECFSNLDGTWEDAPKDKVINVYVQRKGVYPAANPDRIYTTVLTGLDNYFWECNENDVYIFGAWTEEENDGVLWLWYPTSQWQERSMIDEKPDFVKDSIIKTGIWVEEPWASKLGLSGELDFGPGRIIKGCI